MNLKQIFLSAFLLLQVPVAAAGNMTTDGQWWKEAIVYQIYPASFLDTDGNGWGDIAGINSKLDYIKDLGVDMIWLSPFYESPMIDMGYDVSNYASVNPLFGGKMEDIDYFIEQVHLRGMYCIFDLVINHSSDQHRWFQESRSSKDSPKRDWYFWKDAQWRNGTRIPPNNWASDGESSAWQWEVLTGQYYYHSFAPSQVDYDWTNPETRNAIYNESMFFWLDKGIDGFRIDVFSRYSKKPGFPNIPANDTKLHSGLPYVDDGPKIHDYWSEIHDKVLSKYRTFTVGEYHTTDNMTQVQNFIAPQRKEINTVFLKNMADVGRDDHSRSNWTLNDMREAIQFVQDAGDPKFGGGWNTIFMENHDYPRSVSWFCDDSPDFRNQSAKMLSVLQTTLSGTLFLLQQQEIGMINYPSDEWSMADIRDYIDNDYLEEVHRDGGDVERAFEDVKLSSRDNARTPFNWNRTGEFSSDSTTWIKQVNKEINLADQLDDQSSVYNFWKTMILIRKLYRDVFNNGAFHLEDDEDSSFLVYSKKARESEGEAWIIINWSKNDCLKPPVSVPEGFQLLISTHDSKADDYDAYEARVYTKNL